MSPIIFIKNVNEAQKNAFRLIWENKTVSIKKCRRSASFNGSCVSLIISEKKKKIDLAKKVLKPWWKKNKYVPEDVKFFLFISGANTF